MKKEEAIKSAVEKIRKLWNENPDFQKALCDAIGISANGSGGSSAGLSNVEHYLGLDYEIDSQASTIDYSFVKDDRIRNLLQSDNREMMRFRHGTRGHKIDFESYCCYACLQAEMLLNYYFYTVNGDDEESILENIKMYNEKANAISLSYELYAFTKQFDLPYSIYNSIDNVRKVRNTQFHRSKEKEREIDIDKKREELKMNGIPLSPNGTIAMKKITNENIKRKADREKNTESYKRYLHQIWFVKHPFTEIHEALVALSSKVKEETERHKQK